jgi:UDP-N-acetylglucosamine 2-epimerase (non-hydrolysing)
MSEKTMTVDFSGPLTEKDIALIEEKSNLAVYKNADITVSFPTKEEAAALGKPTLVLRDKTERTEGGSLVLVGTNEDDIVSVFDRLITDKKYYNSIKNAPNPFGDGKASERIADILERI